MILRLPKMIQEGSNSAFHPTLMLPISRYVPSGAVMRSPSSTTSGWPTSSSTTSPPQLSVSSRTRLTRRVRCPELPQIHERVGAELTSQLEPLVDAVDDDDAAGAHLARHGAGVDAE